MELQDDHWFILSHPSRESFQGPTAEEKKVSTSSLLSFLLQCLLSFTERQPTNVYSEDSLACSQLTRILNYGYPPPPRIQSKTQQVHCHTSIAARYVSVAVCNVSEGL